jgi:ABC-type protease/lipase transport system fused ATPase/permease subunit
MLQIYDRVLTSHSVPTLMALSVLTVGLCAFQSLLDLLRSQALVRLGSASPGVPEGLHATRRAIVVAPTAQASPTMTRRRIPASSY